MTEPPTTGIVDFARLVLALGGDALRHPLNFSAQAVFRTWAMRASRRLASDNLIVNFGLKRVLLVGSRDLSMQILAQTPSRDGIAAGSLKRSAMAFLAADALTISDNQDWVRRRAFNEAVLEPERRHEFAPQFVRYTLKAFAPPIAVPKDLRAAMGRAMLGVVFGGDAPTWLVEEIEMLFGLVQNPVKRVLIAPWAHWKRARLYDALRALWQAPPADKPSLLRMARGSAASLDDTELLEQIPHWMFTFTGSATDLVTRTLALIISNETVRDRVMAELAVLDSLDEKAFEFATLPLIEACLLEAAHLYPPVTRTFHCARLGAVVGDVQIPAGMEIMHLFPLFKDDVSGEGARSRHFNPDRWMQGAPPVCSFDPFLGGARRCPGKSLILLVCKAALASLLVQHRLAIHAPGLRKVPLPLEFPRRGIRFQSNTSSPVGS